MNTHLLVRLNELAELRASANALDDEWADRLAALKAQHADLIARCEAAEKAVADAERDVRAMAEAEYAETLEKKPAPGVVIREVLKLEYDDSDALAWAKQTGMALTPESLDRKAFEKIAKATELPFVTKGIEPVVTIATDIGKALAEVGNA